MPDTAADIRFKRVYLPAASDDGQRILVDRIWPRGIRKADARLQCWMKDVAPSTGLRRWFGHRSERWEEFRRRYRSELDENHAVTVLAELVRRGTVTLLYGARDELHNQAVVLAEHLRTLARHERTTAQ